MAQVFGFNKLCIITKTQMLISISFIHNAFSNPKQNTNESFIMTKKQKFKVVTPQSFQSDNYNNAA